MSILQDFALSGWGWGVVLMAAFLIGFSKTAISGVMLLAIPILAGIFGGKVSTGMMLPMLIIGDIFAVNYYHTHADWEKIRKLIPFTALGVILGAVVGHLINDAQFSVLIAITVLVCLGLLILFEKKGDTLHIPNHIGVSLAAGIACGFTSMIGNASAPILSIYLLAMGYKKNDFMGTSAWFFLLLNAFKIPFQVFVWHNITLQTLEFSLILAIPIAIGAFTGVVVLKRINEDAFRKIVMVMTALAAIKLIFF